MKRLVLLASVLAAVSALAGCGPHPNDITDDLAAATATTAWA